VTPVITGPAADFAGTGAMATTADRGNNPSANTTGPNSLTEPAIAISLLISNSRRNYTFRA
jgi:hypothetical protein